jgi:hypothetical protein
VLRFELRERLVVGLLVEQHRSQPQPRDVAQVVEFRALDHPLQLRLRGLQVVAIEVKTRGGKRAHRRIQRARIAFGERAGRVRARPSQSLAWVALASDSYSVLAWSACDRWYQCQPDIPRIRARPRYQPSTRFACVLPPRLQRGKLFLLFRSSAIEAPSVRCQYRSDGGDDVRTGWSAAVFVARFFTCTVFRRDFVSPAISATRNPLRSA